MYNNIIKIDRKSKVHKDLLKIIGRDNSVFKPYNHSDKITFLENSNGLYSDGAAQNFRKWLIENKIMHNVIMSVSDMPIELLKEIIEHTTDIIVFETTGTYEITKTLRDYLIQLTKNGHHRKVIECCIREPHFGTLPDEVNEDYLKVYSLNSYKDNMNDWKLTRVRKRDYED